MFVVCPIKGSDREVEACDPGRYLTFCIDEREAWHYPRQIRLSHFFPYDLENLLDVTLGQRDCFVILLIVRCHLVLLLLFRGDFSASVSRDPDRVAASGRSDNQDSALIVEAAHAGGLS